MKVHLYRYLLAVIALCFIQIEAQALPDWMPGKNLLISRSIDSWNSDNKAKVIVELQRSGLYKVKLPYEKWEETVLALTGKITNNSDDTLAAIVLDYIVSNKKTNTEVVRIRLAIEVEVYKTVSIDLKNALRNRPVIWAKEKVVGLPYDPKKDSVILLDTVKAAIEQLGDEYQWSYQYLAAMPKAIVSEKGDDACRWHCHCPASRPWRAAD